MIMFIVKFLCPSPCPFQTVCHIINKEQSTDYMKFNAKKVKFITLHLIELFALDPVVCSHRWETTVRSIILHSQMEIYLLFWFF